MKNLNLLETSVQANCHPRCRWFLVLLTWSSHLLVTGLRYCWLTPRSCQLLTNFNLRRSHCTGQGLRSCIVCSSAGREFGTGGPWLMLGNVSYLWYVDRCVKSCHRGLETSLYHLQWASQYSTNCTTHPEKIKRLYFSLQYKYIKIIKSELVHDFWCYSL